MQNRFAASSPLSWARTAIPAFLVLFLVACRGASWGSMTSLHVGTTTNEVNLLILIAQDRGYFAGNGLDVTRTTYPSGVAGLAGLLDHEVELVTGSEFAFVDHVLQDAGVCALAVIDRSAIEYLVCRGDRGIESVADLKGKTVGVPLGSRPEFALHRFLYLEGIDVADVRLVDVPVDRSAEALTSGEVDAIAAWQPYTTQASEWLEGQVVSWSVQEDQPSYTLLMSRSGWAADNRDVSVRFLTSLLRAEEYVAANPEDAIAFMHDMWDYDEAYVESIWPEHSFSVLLDQALVVAMEDQARWIMSHDQAGKRQMPDFLDSICAEGLEAVKPEAVKLIR